MKGILSNTIDFLLAQPEAQSRQIRSLYLDNYYTVLQLDDESLAACVSDYHLDGDDLKDVERSIRGKLRADPLLIRFTNASAEMDGIARSIRLTIANALSVPILRNGQDSFFDSCNGFPSAFFEGIDYAVVVGFGALVNHLVHNTTVAKIHYADSAFRRNRNRAEAQLARLGSVRKGLTITGSDVLDSAKYLGESDLAAISSSALINHSIDSLLPLSRKCKKIVVLGESAAIHPKFLFESGVHVIITMPKPSELMSIVTGDRNDDALRRFFDQRGLPCLCLWPKGTALVDINSNN